MIFKNLKLLTLTIVGYFILFNTTLLAQPVVGVSLPLSGPVAGMGEAFKNGLTFCQQQLTANDQKYSIVFDDHRYDGKQTLNTYYSLTSQPDLTLLIVWGNQPAEVMAPIAAKGTIPLLAISTDPHGKGHEMVATFGAPIADYAKQAANYFKKNKSQRPAALYANIGNAANEVDFFEKEFSEKISRISVEGTDKDFRSVITRLKQINPDALMLIMMPDQLTLFAQQAGELKFDTKIVVNDAAGAEDIFNAMSKTLKDLAIVQGKIDPEFIKQYRSKFGNISYIFEAATGCATAKATSSILASLTAKKSFPDAVAAINSKSIKELPGLEVLNNKSFDDYISWSLELSHGAR